MNSVKLWPLIKDNGSGNGAVTRSQRFRRVMEVLRIRNEYGWIVPLRFSESQEILWQHIAPRLDQQQRLWFIVLKGRQVYASTFFEALVFTRTVEQPGTNSLVIAQDFDSSSSLFSMAKRFSDNLPMPKIQTPKVKELTFPFPAAPSIFKVVSAGRESKGRGTTQTCVHASELGFWQQHDILTGLFQALPDLEDTIWVMESTANGKRGRGALFYSEWCRAIAGESDLIPVFIPWFTMRKYRRQPVVLPGSWDEEEQTLVKTFNLDGEQLAWRRYAIATKCQGDKEKFHQEYPCSPSEAFISSGMPAFDPLAITRQEVNTCPPKARGTMDPTTGKFTAVAKGELRVWEMPREGRRYVIGCDTAEGLEGGDYACAQVIDMTSLEQVAVLHGLVPPWDLALSVNHLGRWYNKALVCVEVNGIGHAVQDPLIRVHYYPNLHQWRGKPDRAHIHPSKLFGWETNTYSRPLMIGAGQRAINKDLVVIHDEKTLEEISNFSRSDTGRYEAEAGHDDRVIALLIALRSREENHFPIRAQTQMSEEMELEDAVGHRVRVVEQVDPTLAGQKKISKLLKERAKAAVRSWLEM